MSVQRQVTTQAEFDQFIRRPENVDRRFEFVDGKLYEAPSNLCSSQIAALIIAALVVCLRGKDLGHVTGEQGGYRVGGSDLAPDVAFILKSRQPTMPREGFNPLAPDLAIEVISPSDQPHEIQTTLNKYLAAGVWVWMVYPDRRQVERHRQGQQVEILGDGDTLGGGELLPGFSLPVAEIFPN